MIERIVINTSPLIAFGQMSFFDIAAQLPFSFVCPPEVAAEIDAGQARGYPVSLPAWLAVLPLKAPLSPLALAALDVGEAAVIQLALEQNIETVCIDDLKGRRAAAAVGLQVVGSLGLLGKAKTLGLISQARPSPFRSESVSLKGPRLFFFIPSKAGSM
jgi:predicted nucleic acid-binding protein